MLFDVLKKKAMIESITCQEDIKMSQKNIEVINFEFEKAELNHQDRIEHLEADLEWNPRNYHIVTRFDFPSWEMKVEWVEDDPHTVYSDENYESNRQLAQNETEDKGDLDSVGEVKGDGPECFGSSGPPDNDWCRNYAIEIEDPAGNEIVSFEEIWGRSAWRAGRKEVKYPGVWLADVRVGSKTGKKYYYQYVRVTRPFGVVNYPLVKEELRNPEKARFPYPKIDNLAEELLGPGQTPDDLLEIARRKRRRY